MAKNIYDRICRQCGSSFKGGPRSWYCLDCRTERRRKHDRDCKRNGAKRPIGSIDKCVVCGKEYVVNGGQQKYCEDCAPEQYKAVDRVQGLEYYKINKDIINPVRNMARRKKNNPNP